MKNKIKPNFQKKNSLSCKKYRQYGPIRILNNFSTIPPLRHVRPPCFRYFLEANVKDNCLINSSQSWQHPRTSI